jgi:hypothetical protein
MRADAAAPARIAVNKRRRTLVIIFRGLLRAGVSARVRSTLLGSEAVYLKWWRASPPAVRSTFIERNEDDERDTSARNRGHHRRIRRSGPRDRA